MSANNDKTQNTSAADDFQARLASLKLQEVLTRDNLDEEMGFARYVEGPKRLGWLVNMHETIVLDTQIPEGRAAVDLYFLEEDGGMFKSTIVFEPYFYVLCKKGTEIDVEEYIRKNHGQQILSMSLVQKEDLKMLNHLSGNKRSCLRLNFANNNNLLNVRRALNKFAEKNKKTTNESKAFDNLMDLLQPQDANAHEHSSKSRSYGQPTAQIIDLREHDVPYYVRFAIDHDIRVGLWYEVKAFQGQITISKRTDIVRRAEPVILAFDIETTKLPLKFPDSNFDQIMMISYMIDGQGYLITNREIVSEDIHDFEYTPKPEFEGPFTIFNESDEYHVLQKFFEHIKQTKPTIFVTYNGDFFDWPFVEKRSQIHGFDMKQIIGFSKSSNDGYTSHHATHIDAFCWVKRDSYLPQGSQGLKAVTVAKLGYNPIEIDPEDMTRFASEDPQQLAQYSVSDAVATYYLYMKYVHPFIFSLCNIIPMNPDEVLRRGSGTLCEALLMVEAYRANVIMRNKHMDHGVKFHDGHLLDSETYVGGHVEALQAGVFRSDIATHFNLVPEALQMLMDQVEQALKFSIEVEGKMSIDDVVDYDKVRDEIIGQLADLKTNPNCNKTPLIYHLDVSAMYPNIILTNRLQPDAIVDDAHCAACDYNEGPDSVCQRKLQWLWRGEYFTSTKGDVNMLKNQLAAERFPGTKEGVMVAYDDLGDAEKTTLLKKRVQEYSRKAHGRIHETKTIERESIVCQRENPFYINTVRSFRDRRYEYKGLHKTWKKNLEKSFEKGDLAGADEAKKMIVVYDSLQLAHKCILNSFYGYVMRKGARWYSMEMAGIVCYTGSKIIQLARQIVEQVGRPLELDTDGIWCILPSGFPEDFKLNLKNGKQYHISYPCIMLNHLVHADFTNHQYQDRNGDVFTMRSENSIFFEVDGPYKAMILPSSTEEDKLLKKRYAVFDHDHKLTELKGFELKRRGELKLIKSFQSEIFSTFLEGTTLKECYAASAKVANRWLDLIFSKGAELVDDELFDLISENRSMSKTLEEYGSQKSTSICTAKRLAEFLGDGMVKAKGLACRFIISSKPYGLPVSDRAIPVVIFQTEDAVKKHYLRKWLRDSAQQSFDIRDIIDWNYYLDRFGSVIQKLITIPAAMQNVENPIPRVVHPDWLLKRLRERDSGFKQLSLKNMFNNVKVKKLIEEADDPASEDGDDRMLEDNENRDNMRDIDKFEFDIEDIGKPKSSKFNTKKNNKISKSTTVEETEKQRKEREEKEYLDSVTEQTMFTDYRLWLRVQKRKWKDPHVARPIDRSGINGFLRKGSEAPIYSDWHVVSIVETDVPGEFRLWALVNNELRNFKIKMDREFYINNKTPASSYFGGLDDVEVNETNKILPGNKPCLHLMSVKMPEYVYQKHLPLIQSLSHRHDIDGIYEAEIPLLFKVLRDSGCLVSITNKYTNLNTTLSLNDLKPIEPHQYLENFNLNVLHCYYAHQGNRHFFSIVNFALNKINVWYVDVSRNRDSLPQVSRLYHEIRQQHSEQVEESVVIKFPDFIRCEDVVVGTDSDMFKQINKEIRSLAKSSSYLVVLQTCASMNHLKRVIPALKELPVLPMTLHRQDNKLPALGWQLMTAKKMLSHTFLTDQWIGEKLTLARYADVPLCNIDNDYTVFLSDLFLARRLLKNEMLLWWSNADREPENYLTIEQEESQIIINKPGFYGDACLELDLRHLALNALIQSTLSDWQEQQQEDVSTQGQSVSCLFSIVKSMVKTWWVQYTDTQHQLPEIMLEHFYRWLSCRQSRLFDPNLLYFVDQIMKKVFVQLVSEFTRLGSSVVYANFDKLVLATNKKTPQKALGYAAYILESITKKSLFQFLQLDIVSAWTSLYWLDRNNKGGYQFKGDSEWNLEMHWDMARYLPPYVEAVFEEKMRQWMEHVHYVLYPEESNQSVKRPSSKLIEDEGQDDSPVPVIVQLIDFLTKHLKRDLLTLIPAMFRRWQRFEQRQEAELEEDENQQQMRTRRNDTDNSIYDGFPELPGSYLALDNPVLEFIKYFIEVLYLDKQLEQDVRLLRRDLLNLIGIKEYDERGRFQQPAASLVLPQVICPFCSVSKDLDLTSSDVTNHHEDHSESEVLGTIVNKHHGLLLCDSCGSDYDLLDIEQRLIANIHELISKWQVQDLYCKTCHMVTMYNLRQDCTCSRSLMSKLDLGHIEKQIRVHEHVASYYGMKMLQEYTQWIVL